MIKEKIERINDYLKKELWMDFELYGTSFLEVDLSGKIDEQDDEKIKIVFKEPYMISCILLFTYEGDGDFIEILTGEEAYKINKQYGVTQGNYIFELKNTQVEGNMYIIAKDIEVEIEHLNI